MTESLPASVFPAVFPADFLAGRVILVTGAGGGVGRAAALAYARHGATVILLGRAVGKLEQTYDEIVAAGGPQPAIFPLDLASAGDAEYQAMAEAIGYQLGRLDGILHAAAAFESLSPLDMENVEGWTRLFKVNAAAPAAINRACAPFLSASDLASVILIGESHGHAPVAYWGGFAVSKAALEAYFRIQADEWSDKPMRVNLVIPGPLNTPQRARSHPGEDKARLPDINALTPTLLALMRPGAEAPRGRLIEGLDTLPTAP